MECWGEKMMEYWSDGVMGLRTASQYSNNPLLHHSDNPSKQVNNQEDNAGTLYVRCL